MADAIILGIIPSFHFRFAIADISETSQTGIEIHKLNPEMSNFMSKTMLGALFLAELTKDKQRVSIQWKDESKKSVLAYSDRFGRMKAVAYPGEWVGDDIRNSFILGSGILKVIRWEADSNFYQSYTNLLEDTFEVNFERYIEDSEQIRTLVAMDCHWEESRLISKGLMLQALPEASQDQFEAIRQRLQNTWKIQSFWQKSPKEMIHELSSLLEEDFKILTEHIPEFLCDCSRNKIADIIVSLGQVEAESILNSEGKIEVTCEFCGTSYDFSRGDIHRYFST